MGRTEEEKRKRREYDATTKGKAVRREWRQTEAGVMNRRKYDSSPEAAAARKKYRSSDKFKATDRKWRGTERAKKLFIGYSIKHKYGISMDDFDKMLAAQGGVCSICNKTNECGRRLCIDHNHKSGQVRGLLCTTCNTMIGAGRENIHTLYAAVDYLNKWESRELLAGVGP